MIVFQFRIIKSDHPEPSMIKFSNSSKGPPRFRPVNGGLVGFNFDFIHSVEAEGKYNDIKFTTLHTIQSARFSFACMISGLLKESSTYNCRKGLGSSLVISQQIVT